MSHDDIPIVSGPAHRRSERRTFIYYRGPSLRPDSPDRIDPIQSLEMEWHISWDTTGEGWEATCLDRSFPELVQLDARTKIELYKRIEAFQMGMGLERLRDK